MAGEWKPDGLDQLLALGIASGVKIGTLAKKHGVHRDTIHIRTQALGFQDLVKKIQSDLYERAMGILAADQADHAKVIRELSKGAKTEAVRLGAAKAGIELGLKMRSAIDTEQRLIALEKALKGESTSTTGQTGTAPGPETPTDSQN